MLSSGFLHCYLRTAIDDFTGTFGLEEIARWRLCRDQHRLLAHLLVTAKQAFRILGCTEVTGGPYFFRVPAELVPAELVPAERVFAERELTHSWEPTAWGIIIKEANNGNTYVASPVPLTENNNFAALRSLTCGDTTLHDQTIFSSVTVMWRVKEIIDVHFGPIQTF